MRKILILISATMAIIGTSFADSININWMVDGSVYDTSICTVGGDLIIPNTAPTKYGYHFVGWAPYTQLEYIESTGTQYIVTGYKPTTQNVTYDFSVQRTSSAGGEAHPSRIAGGNVQFFCIASWYIYELNPELSQQQTGFDSRQKTDVIINNNYRNDIFSVVINGENVASRATARSNNYGTDGSLVLFAFGNTGSYSFTGKMYYYKIYDDGVLTFNAIPVRRNTDGAVGMFDTVSNVFFANSGTDVFVPGPVIGGI